MAKDTMAGDTFLEHNELVDDELVDELNSCYTEWRRGNPDGHIIDWLARVPWSMYRLSGDGFDPDPKIWRAWLDFCIWLTEENRQVAKTGRAERRQRADE